MCISEEDGEHEGVHGTNTQKDSQAVDFHDPFLGRGVLRKECHVTNTRSSSRLCSGPTLARVPINDIRSVSGREYAKRNTALV